MKHILTLCLMLVVPFSYAEQLQIESGLTAEQEAKLILQAAEMATENRTKPKTVVPDISAQEVKEWAEIGNVVGDGLANAAGKMGIAVNDFADSKVGIFTMVIIAWHYLGNDFTGFVFGMGWLMLMVPGWLYCYRRLFIIESITLYDKKESGGKTKEIEYGNGKGVPDATTFFYWASLVLICVVGIAAVL